MNHKLDASEQRQLLGELQALRNVLESSASEGSALAGASAASELPAMLTSASGAPGLTGTNAPPQTAQFTPNEPPLLDDVVSFAVATAHPDPTAIDTSHVDSTHGDTSPAEDALELQFGLDDPDWSQFVDQVFSEHKDLAVDHSGRAAGTARNPERSRDAMLLEELTRKLDARLAKLRQTLLMEIKDMLRRRGRLR